MFCVSRWKYSGVPGAGPAAHPAVAAMRIQVIASARPAPIRLPIVFASRDDSVPLPGGAETDTGLAQTQDTTSLCLREGVRPLESPSLKGSDPGAAGRLASPTGP